MNPAFSPALLEQVRVAFEQISDLPLRVHVTDVEGKFLFANAEARIMFGLNDDLSKYNIATFYEDEKERQYVLNVLKKVVPAQWRKDFKALLLIEGERIKVRFSSKPFFDENGAIYAMLNLTESMRRVEWYADLEDELEVGLFMMDRHLKIADCNHFLAEILGFDSTADLKGKPVTEFMWEPNAANDLLKALLETPKLRKEPMKLKRKDGAMVLIEMSCDASSLEAGEISRVRGVIKDITFKVFYDDLPVGLFLINSSLSGEDIVSQVNYTFAKMHGFEKVSDVLGKPSDIFQANPVSYAKYKEELNKAARENRPLLDYYMEIKDKQGRKRNVIVNVRFLPDQDGQIRVGAVYDLTDHVAKNTRTLEADFGALLHTYIATVNGLRDTMGMLVKAHGHDVLVQEKNVNRVAATNLLNGHKKRLETLLPELEKMAEERKVNADLIERLRKPWRRFSEKQMEREKDNAAWARRNMIEMRNGLESLRNTTMPRELVKNVRSEIDEILRITTVLSLALSLDELNERIPEFYYFRDYMRRKDTDLRDVKPQNIIPALVDATQFLEEFASIRKVAIAQHYNAQDNILVRCNRASLNRAFHCLLHNAIKYSWSKKGDNPPYVDVRVDKKQDTVEISIENWGVAIRKEELENDLIFNFGQRGSIADDRGRSGTGIGLYDAHNIISKLGGSLRISSEPTFGNPPEVYSNPFITKVLITLPIVKQL